MKLARASALNRTSTGGTGLCASACGCRCWVKCCSSSCWAAGWAFADSSELKKEAAALRKRELAYGRRSRLILQEKKSRKFSPGNSLLYISLVCSLLQGASYSGAHPVFVFMETHAVPYATSGSFLRTPSAVVSYKTYPANRARTSKFCVPSELFHLPSSSSFNTFCPAQTSGNQYPSAGASS